MLCDFPEWFVLFLSTAYFHVFPKHMFFILVFTYFLKFQCCSDVFWCMFGACVVVHAFIHAYNTYIHIYIYVFMHIYIYICTYSHTYVYICICICIYVLVYIYIYIHEYSKSQ